MIEEAIVEDTQWAVFEPNDAGLWREVDRVDARVPRRALARAACSTARTAAEAYSRHAATRRRTRRRTIERGRLICRDRPAAAAGRPSSWSSASAAAEAAHRDRRGPRERRVAETGARNDPVPRLPLRGHARRPARRRVQRVQRPAARDRGARLPRGRAQHPPAQVPDPHQADQPHAQARHRRPGALGLVLRPRRRAGSPSATARSSSATRPATESSWSGSSASAFPCKWIGPDLNAPQSAVAVETLELCHQGLERRRDRSVTMPIHIEELTARSPSSTASCRSASASSSRLVAHGRRAPRGARASAPARRPRDPRAARSLPPLESRG